MNKIRIAGVAISFSLLITGINAQISLPSIFADHMVLQQQSNVPVWGWGVANTDIKVVGSWAPKDTAVAKVASDGSWKTTLPTAIAGGPYTLSIEGSGNKVLQDVMLGEVWLCSGQSNMEWSASAGIDNAEQEIADANNSNIRFFHIPKRGASTPQNNCEATWAACTPDVMKNTSAVSYFFGRNLQDSLNVPIGLIVSAWGGTPAEVWATEKSVMNNDIIRTAMPDKTYPWWPVEPGSLYNQMINPIVPFALAGSIWYQGESNQDHASTYGILLKTMIEDWRKEFDKEFPFYLVQIAPFTYNTTDNGPAIIREAQEWVTENVPQTGMIVVSDLVADVKNIHPTDKQNVGLRLAKLALAKDYGRLIKGYQSPTFQNISIEKNKAIITFNNAEGGIICNGKDVNGLQIAGADGLFTKAKGIIKNGKLIVSSPEVKTPVAVRYCFDDATIGNLFSAEGLPAAPFRTDSE